MARDTNSAHERYEGPGKGGQALATGTLWGAVGGTLGAGTMGIGVLKSFKDMAGGLVGKSPTTISGKALLITGFLLGPIGFVVGAVRGWLKAGKAQTQFEDMQSARQELAQENAALKGQVGGLESEVAMLREHAQEHHEERRQFRDHHKPRADHGSHAAVADHEKAQAADKPREH